MSERQDFSDLGGRIQSAVQEALDTGNFRQIQDIVQDTASLAAQEVRSQVSQAQDRFAEWTVQKERKQLPAVYLDKRGRTAGILFTVFGSIGLGIFGLPAFALLIYLLVSGDGFGFLMLLLFAVPAAVCGVMLGKGCSLRGRLRRAQRYVKLVQERMYMELEELASRTGQSVRRVRKDIRRMLQEGIFPEGHLDPEERLFMLDDVTWKQYMEARRQWERRIAADQKSSEEGGICGHVPEELPEEAEMEQTGRTYMDRLRRLNEEIPGRKISDKLDRLDYLLQHIFRMLKAHPEKCPQMCRFMDYYLPTTVKLAEAYADFDRAGIEGENISAAKAEIEKTMDTINQAFERLLDDMYQDAAFEAAADARVLKTILTQDGYMGSEFASGQRKEG